MSERIPRLIRNRANGVVYPYDQRLMDYGQFDVVEYCEPLDRADAPLSDVSVVPAEAAVPWGKRGNRKPK